MPEEVSQRHQIICSCELLRVGIELRSSELLTFELFPESTGITSIAAMKKLEDGRGFLDQTLI